VTGSHPHVVIVGDGDVDGAELARLAAGGVHGGLSGSEPGSRPFILAADGGGSRCLAAGVRPDRVIGDLDSLAAEERTRLEDLGVDIEVADPAKDESDMELCVAAALRLGATRITILGALGLERPEHSIANLLLLADPRLAGVAVAILGRGSVISRIGTADGPGQASLAGHPGDYVSLFPLGAAASGVTTSGLRFPLRGETLTLGPSRGLSNELLGSVAQVSTQRGCLLVVQTPGPGQSRREATPAQEGDQP
jgi:thiamine pyrophosphokinase